MVSRIQRCYATPVHLSMQCGYLFMGQLVPTWSKQTCHGSPWSGAGAGLCSLSYPHDSRIASKASQRARLNRLMPSFCTSASMTRLFRLSTKISIRRLNEPFKRGSE